MARTPLTMLCSSLCWGLLAVACGDDGEPTADAADIAAPQDTAVADTSAPADTIEPPADTAQPPADTTPPQDTAAPQDTTPPDLGEGTCPGILACTHACAAGDDVCAAACVAAADDLAETTAYTALATCLGAAGCTSPDGTLSGDRAYYQCQRQCLDELALCVAGSFGAAACPATNGCVINDCFAGDILCERACMSGATQTAVEHLLDWSLCALAQCFDPNDVVGQEGCIQQVRNQPACSDPYTQCFGDVGAAPGPGPGGGR